MGGPVGEVAVGLTVEVDILLNYRQDSLLNIGRQRTIPQVRNKWQVRSDSF